MPSAGRIDRRAFTRSLAIGCAEIAHHGIGFPQHIVAVHQRRHAAIGIYRQIRRLVVLAELHAGVDALIGEIEFGEAPQHFLHIDRIGPAPDGELLFLVVGHALSLPLICVDAFIAEDQRKSAGFARGHGRKNSAKNQAPPRCDGARSCLVRRCLRRSAAEEQP